MRLSNAKVFLSDDINSESRVMIYRDIEERVNRVAPFLTLDRDPYMVILDGKLVWVLDAYTTTSRFPYSMQPEGSRVNYLRNSVKVVVDAYHGTPTFYQIDENDPIVSSWAGAFPELFTPLSEMGPELQAHLRYPADLFAVQSELFAIYHMTDPQVFYNREDEWEVPTFADRSHPRAYEDPRFVRWEKMEPYYTVMKLPGETEEEFILMRPFNPREKPNLAAWMVGRSDGDAYGQMRVYKFPKEKMVYGPNMVVARFNQDDKISEKLSLWNQQGSKVVLGTLLVIPIEEALVYIQPLYLQAEDGSIPELKRVIVGYEDEIAMADTLEEGLEALFGGTRVTPAPEDGDTTPGFATSAADASWAELASEAKRRYQTASAAAQEGRWADYGSELDALGDALIRLEALGGEAPVDDDMPDLDEDEPAAIETDDETPSAPTP
jgi:hypothetical protein